MVDATIESVTGETSPADHFFNTLLAAIQALPRPPYQDLGERIIQDTARLIDGLMAVSPPQAPAEISNVGKSDQRPFAIQRDFDRTKAAATRNSSERAANTPLIDEVEKWQSAITAYQFALERARWQLNNAVTEARTTYTTNSREAAASRLNKQYFELREVVTNAVMEFTTAAAAAAATLATEAGQLLAAYATYIATLETVQAGYQHNLAVVDQAYWLAVETTSDDA